MEFVGGDDLLIGVAELKPPSVADGFDLEHIAHVGGRATLLFPNADDRWYCDSRDDQRRDDRPGDFELGVAMDLLGDLVVTASVSKRDVDDSAFDDDEHGDCDPKDQEEKIALITRDRTGISESRLRVFRGACRDKQCGGESQHGKCELSQFGGSQPVLHRDAVLSKSGLDGLSAFLCGSVSSLGLASLESIDIERNLVIRISFRAASRKVNKS